MIWLAAATIVGTGVLYLWIRLRIRRTARRRELDLTRSVAMTDGMTGQQFELWTAALLRREGFTDVQVFGGANDCGADVVAVAPNGARTVVQCKRYAATRKVSSPDVQRFAGTVRALHEAQVALLVTTGGITTPAADIAERLGITVVTRPELMEWAANGKGPTME